MIEISAGWLTPRAVGSWLAHEQISLRPQLAGSSAYSTVASFTLMPRCT